MKVGFTAGAFDLFHAGHVAMMQEAKTVCDYLIVGIQTDPTIDRPNKNKPVQSIVERQIQVKACKYVDETIVYRTEADLLDLLSILPIDIRIKGEDHKDNPVTNTKERTAICKIRGIKVYYTERKHRFSTTELRKRIKK